MLTYYSALCTGNDSATSNTVKLVHWPLMGWLLRLVQRWGDWAGPQPPVSLLAVPNVTAHPSTVNVPIAVFLYNGLMLCSFSVTVKALKETFSTNDARQLLGHFSSKKNVTFIAAKITMTPTDVRTYSEWTNVGNFPLDIPLGHIAPRTFSPPGQFPPFLHGVRHFPLPPHHAPVYIRRSTATENWH